MASPYSALLFDLDGTLIDSQVDLAAAVNYVLKNLGHPPQTVAQVSSKVGSGLRELLRDTLSIEDPGILGQAKRLFNNYYMAHCVEETELYPNVEETLEHLAAFHKLGIVTNKPKVFADKILSNLGLARFFPVVVGGDTLQYTKPHPAPVIKALKDLNVISEGVILVGDGAQDIMAGQSAGTKTCVVTYGFGYHETHSTLMPDFKINRFEDLKEIVK